MFYWHGFGGAPGYMGWGLFMLFKLLSVALIVGVIYLFLKAVEKRTSPEQTRLQEPITLLKERYAKGEISLDEFKRIKEELLKN